jgi:hypothetical protein
MCAAILPEAFLLKSEASLSLCDFIGLAFAAGRLYCLVGN